MKSLQMAANATSSNYCICKIMHWHEEFCNSHKIIEVSDLTGRIILTNESSKGLVNISVLAGDIYYVKIKNDNAMKVIKIVKQ